MDRCVRRFPSFHRLLSKLYAFKGQKPNELRDDQRVFAIRYSKKRRGEFAKAELKSENPSFSVLVEIGNFFPRRRKEIAKKILHIARTKKIKNSFYLTEPLCWILSNYPKNAEESCALALEQKQKGLWGHIDNHSSWIKDYRKMLEALKRLKSLGKNAKKLQFEIAVKILVPNLSLIHI